MGFVEMQMEPERGQRGRNHAEGVRFAELTAALARGRKQGISYALAHDQAMRQVVGHDVLREVLPSEQVVAQSIGTLPVDSYEARWAYFVLTDRALYWSTKFLPDVVRVGLDALSYRGMDDHRVIAIEWSTADRLEGRTRWVWFPPTDEGRSFEDVLLRAVAGPVV